MIVKEVMKKPFVIEKDMPIFEAAHLMSSHNIGSLLIVSKGNLKGIITERDLLKNFGKESKVFSIMSTKIITGKQDMDLVDALRVLRENKIKRLPIVDKKGVLLGIITLTDIVAHSEDLDEEEFFFE